LIKPIESVSYVCLKWKMWRSPILYPFMTRSSCTEFSGVVCHITSNDNGFRTGIKLIVSTGRPRLYRTSLITM
jgi:hypothetical protein